VVLLSGASCPGKSSGVVMNSDPQPEGYSYVNLAVVTTVGMRGPQIAATRPTESHLSAKRPYFCVVGCPGTLTS
jgi:hypothetical protein